MLVILSVYGRGGYKFVFGGFGGVPFFLYSDASKTREEMQEYLQSKKQRKSANSTYKTNEIENNS